TIVNVRDAETEQDARTRLARPGADPSGIVLNRLPLNDIWFRDHGPLFVQDPQRRAALTGWECNAWGGQVSTWHADSAAPARVAELLVLRRFDIPFVMEGGALEINGEGVCFTTRSCLQSQERNPELDEPAVERLLH